MAINANNIIIKGVPPQAAATPVKVIPKKKPASRRKYAESETLLVVDGKEKKISRKSKYLIDMLTIEENDK